MGYGGTIGGTLTLGGTAQKIKGIRFNIKRGAVQAGTLDAFRTGVKPGRVTRGGSFTLYVQTSTADDALWAHVDPPDAASNAAASLAMVWVSAMGRTRSMNIVILELEQVEDNGEDLPAVYECTFAEVAP